jgi:hypothetical protein
VISPTQRSLPDNTQHSQEADIYAHDGIRTHNPSKRAAVDPRLRPRGHWDRPCANLNYIIGQLWCLSVGIGPLNHHSRRSHIHSSQGIVMCTNFHKFNYWKESKAGHITISKCLSSWDIPSADIRLSEMGKASNLMEFQLKSTREIRLLLYQKSLHSKWNLPHQSRSNQDNSKVQVIGH